MKKGIKQLRKEMWFLIVDIFSIVLSYLLTLHFRYTLDAVIPMYGYAYVWITISTAVVVYLTNYGTHKVYRNILRYTSIKYYVFLASLTMMSGIIMILLSVALKLAVGGKWFMDWKGNLLASLLIIFFVIGIRGLVRISYSYKEGKKLRNNKKGYKNLLIVGAGSAAEWLVRSIKNSTAVQYNIIGLIDDDPKKLGTIVYGETVLGNRLAIPKICKDSEVEEILIAIPTLEDLARQRIYSICTETGVTVKTLPSMNEIVNNTGSVGAADAIHHIREVRIEDLLARKPVMLDNEQLHGEINGKIILVTGGGGSIGSELCRQISRHNPGRLIVLDIYENNAYDLQMELQSKYPQMDLQVVIASVRDYNKIEQIFDEYRPEVVFHAAAHKHVPLMEFNPGESIKNNVFGTYNVAMAADKFKVKRFVLISTDKAVNPTNIMGATKRICEMIVQSMQEISKTEFVAVRFGNVLGSNGSVIPLFKRQIEKREPITVTHKDITRFFMTIPEAAQLVLQAACYAKGGEIFVLDMGQPVKIYDLALNLIRLSGLKPFEDIDVVVTGLRPGEKLYEELLMNEEGLTGTENSKIFIGKPIFTNIETLRKSLKKLEEAMVSDDKEYIKDVVAEVVPTYVRNGKQPTQETEKAAEA